MYIGTHIFADKKKDHTFAALKKETLSLICIWTHIDADIQKEACRCSYKKTHIT